MTASRSFAFKKFAVPALALAALLVGSTAGAETKAECRRRVRQEFGTNGCFRICRQVPSIIRGRCTNECRKLRARLIKANCAAL